MTNKDKPTPGILSRIVPERRKTVKFSWIKRGWMLFSLYSDARSYRNMHIDKSCWWCRRKFEDSDMLALAHHDKGNILLCDDCAESAINQTSTDPKFHWRNKKAIESDETSGGRDALDQSGA